MDCFPCNSFLFMFLSLFLSIQYLHFMHGFVMDLPNQWLQETACKYDNSFVKVYGPASILNIHNVSCNVYCVLLSWLLRISLRYPIDRSSMNNIESKPCFKCVEKFIGEAAYLSHLVNYHGLKIRKSSTQAPANWTRFG